MRHLDAGRVASVQRRAAAFLAGLVAVLALTACSGSGEESQRGEVGVETDAPEVTSAESEGAEFDGSSDELGRYTTEGGIFSWTLPDGWTATTLERDPGWEEELGIPYESIRFDNADRSIGFDAEIGNGSRKHDRPWPYSFEVVDTERLPNAPQPNGESGEVWYQAALVSPSDRPDGDRELWVRVATAPEGDPLGQESDEYWYSWGYYTPPVKGYSTAAFHILRVYILQDEAEKITGLDGEVAVRGLMDTAEYLEMKELATSMVVVTAPDGRIGRQASSTGDALTAVRVVDVPER